VTKIIVMVGEIGTVEQGIYFSGTIGKNYRSKMLHNNYNR
jgi:hypothetical protein